MKTTKKDFEEFKAEFNRMVELLGLKSWNVFFKCTKLNDGVAANIDYDTDSRCAEVSLNTIKYVVDLKRSAKHEAFHLLLADLYESARDRFVDEKTLNKNEEAVIVALEKLDI